MRFTAFFLAVVMLLTVYITDTFAQQYVQPDMQATASASSAVNANYNNNYYQQKTVWQKIGTPFVAAGKYTWYGVKTLGIWTWKGVCAGAYYTKEGCISVAEKTGMKSNPDDIAMHERVMQEANEVLIESRTRREIRRDNITEVTK